MTEEKDRDGRGRKMGKGGTWGRRETRNREGGEEKRRKDGRRKGRMDNEGEKER